MNDEATKKDAENTSVQQPAEKPASPQMDNEGWGNPSASSPQPAAPAEPGPQTTEAARPTETAEAQVAADTVNPAENAPDEEPSADADTENEPSEAEGGDELVTSPENPPETAAKSENFARVEKGNFVSTVTYYSNEEYGEFVLEDISGLVQNGPTLRCICRASGFVYELEVQPDEALNIFNKWRSLKAQRRNA